MELNKNTIIVAAIDNTVPKFYQTYKITLGWYITIEAPIPKTPKKHKIAKLMKSY